MQDEPLDRLGQILMGRVRDKAIADWDRILDGRMKGETAELVRSELGAVAPGAKTFLHWVLPRIVDTTLHHLLWTLEQERSLRLGVEAEGSSVPDVSAVSDGLAGELYGSKGWIARFSAQRHEERPS